MAAKKQVQKKVVGKKEVPSPKPVKKATPAAVVEEVVEESVESEDSEREEVEEDEDMADDEDADVEDDDDEDDDDELNDMELDDGVRQPKKYNKRQPILARSKGLERKLEDEKLDYKARKIMSAEKKALKEKGRIIPDFTTFEYEKRLRKVATRGVVKLFNAIRTQQKVTEVAVQNASDTRKTLASIEKAKSASTMTKSSFLDLLKTGQK
ncbi:unnamed protein product [Mucor hiemalis]